MRSTTNLFEPIATPTIATPPRMVSWAVASALVFLALAVAYVLYVASVPVLVLYVMVHPMPVETPIVTSGESVRYSLDYCKFVDTAAGVIRELRRVDGTLTVPLSESGSVLPVGCGKTSVLEPIPSYVPPGEYVMRLTRSYRRTTYRDYPRVLETAPFTVRAKP